VITVLQVLGSLWLFWLLYVFTMAIYRAKLAGRLSNVALLLAFPFVILAAAVDLTMQFTLASVIFREWPKRDASGKLEILVTARLQSYLKNPSGWRKTWAVAICTKLLDPFNATDEPHC
jgi:hypothetical protein